MLFKFFSIFLILGMVVFGYLYCCNQNSVAGGVKSGQLALLPSGCENGVFSNANNHRYIAPFEVSGLENPIKQLEKIISDWPRAEVVTVTETYLHAIFWSKIFKFVDDVELLWIPEEQKVEVRGLARCGYSDLGVNRQRLEELRVALEELQSE